MNGFVAGLISVGILAVLLGGTCGITLLVCHIIDKIEEKKWIEAKRKHPEIDLLLQKIKLHWKKYDNISEIAMSCKKQIDTLLGNLTYLPTHEKEWREQQAEAYKEIWYSAQSMAKAEYNKYLKYHKALEEFCETHNIKRME